jgi:hypothetical protein
VKFRRILVALFVTAAGGLAGVASATPASASTLSPAATCFGYGCHGHDPVIYNCAVASTTTTSDGLMTLQNRYSSNCNANWARAELSASALGAYDTLEVAVTTSDSHGQTETMCYPGPSNTGNLIENCTGSFGGSGFAYTDMVDGTNLTTAEAIVLNSSGQQIDFLQVQQ